MDPRKTESAAPQLGAARIVLLLAFPLLPFVVSGPIRAITLLPLSLSLALALVASGGCLWLIWRNRMAFATDRRTLLAALVSLGCVAAVELKMLYNPYFYGLPHAYGPDVGSHVYDLRIFETLNPRIYTGCVSFYSLVHWFGRLFSARTFASFRFGYYAGVLCVALALTAAALVCLSSLRARQQPIIGLMVVTAFSAVGMVYLLSPLLGYYQLDGFYPQVFSVAPLLMTWMLYVVSERPMTRALLAGSALVLVRYTYALNVPDLCVTAAVLFIDESLRLPSPWARRLAWFASLPCLGAAFVGLRMLYALRNIRGLFWAYDWFWAFIGQLVLSVGLLVMPAALRAIGRPASPAVRRMLLFAGVFGATNWLAQAAYHATGQPVQYFFLKYNFSGLVVVLSAAVIATAWMAYTCFSVHTRAAAAAAAVALLVACVGGGALLKGTGKYRSAAFERAFGRPPFSFHGFYDPAADWLIRDTLRRTGKHFGGFHDGFFPLHFFMNTDHQNLGDGGGNYGAWLSRQLLFPEKPGYCYFWTEPIPHLPWAAEIKRLKTIGKPVCHSYYRRWAPTQRMNACAVCL